VPPPDGSAHTVRIRAGCPISGAALARQQWQNGLPLRRAGGFRFAGTDAASVAICRVTRSYRHPQPLGGHHDLSCFRCRSSEQTDWLARYDRQSAATGTTRVFVVTEHGDDRVVAYYAWCMAQVHAEVAPARLRKGAGRYPQPVALLARLGVDVDHEGRRTSVSEGGLGTKLHAASAARICGYLPPEGGHHFARHLRDLPAHRVPAGTHHAISCSGPTLARQEHRPPRRGPPEVRSAGSRCSSWPPLLIPPGPERPERGQSAGTSGRVRHRAHL
jgi:hypothetical protein